MKESFSDIVSDFIQDCVRADEPLYNEVKNSLNGIIAPKIDALIKDCKVIIQTKLPLILNNI